MSEIDQDLINAAKQHFGITHNPKETGYILPDGTRLDLSGKHYSNDYIRDKKTNKNVLKKPGNDYLRNNRIVDHRELFDHPNLTSTGTDKMLEFMRKTGAMRVMPGIGVSTVRMPTDAQINKSVADHRRISPDDELWVDTKDGKEFGNAFDGKFKNPTVEKVKSHFVKEYLNKNINEDLRKWFREKWVRFDTKGNIKGDCAREPGEGKPKCLPQAKAHALGKKKRASAARRKRREDPHPERKGKAKFVKTHNEETIYEIRDAVKAAIIHRRQLTRSKNTC